MKFPNNLNNDVVVIKANHVVDVFFGNNGWEPHARFLQRKTPKGTFLTQVTGVKVPPSVFNQVLSKVQ